MDMSARFLDTCASVCTPVAIATSIWSGRPHGTTVSAFMSLSLTPPLVALALDRRSALLRTLRRAGRVGINVLTADQERLARVFARTDVDRFAGVAWTEDHALPRLAGQGGWIACEVVDLVRGGDHLIVVGHVLHAVPASAPPLVYHERAFGTAVPGPALTPFVPVSP
ncbi:flavin reductase family protein [Microbispora sp. NEAU-D428]|uniref:flavin reductase family protein n=1 Tax=Microbispora sitophila TaxID=2771537 RepID=UPI00186939AB|nr:flavin reductase family protein [Microbispora sitophila]MBE3016053.1 flavin reductase family protein [Microbispora sitophila]